MTKKELSQYRHLVKECNILETRIRKKERDAEKVATVKSKVQMSQKEFPYVEEHLTVDAPEPKQYTAIQRDLYLLRQMKAAVEWALAELDGYIARIDDSRARMIITYVYVEGHSQKQTGIEFDLTESAVSKIISKTLQKFN